MGGLCCKTRRIGTPSPLLRANTSSQLTEDLSSYEDAFKRDPELQSFDVTLHGRTNHVIKSLADHGVEIRSLGSFKEVTNCLLEMNQDVVKVILESKEDIWDNPELFGLVEEYFKSSVKTLEFCTALGSCLARAKNSKLIIQLAIDQFEEEVAMKDRAAENKFVKTLEGLQKFKEAGDPFTPQFFALYESVLVAVAVVAPPVVTALAGAIAGAMTVPIGSVGNWCNTLWDRYEKALEEEKGLVKLIWTGTFVTIEDMVTILKLVEKFQSEIESLFQYADIAIRKEDAVKLVIDEIKTKMEVFMERIENLAAHASKCHDDIIEARRMVLNKILKDADQ
ncbi:UPF0496 PROTEIN 3-RELATED [Salix viminalis]|uniref:UPF0496 PROTEIN 3-RELATED n=1 Tax=Salix viminalis TaxID=40686 RepID=A0A9Q0SIS8_SALVM|nr:UPF0496 PROTEIN 3-RELATED [Salix viminalis]